MHSAFTLHTYIFVLKMFMHLKKIPPCVAKVSSYSAQPNPHTDDSRRKHKGFLFRYLCVLCSEQNYTGIMNG